MHIYKEVLIASLFILFGTNSAVSYAEELLTWEACIKEAQENNPDLVSAREKLNQAIANKDITGSRLLPQITTEFTRQRTRQIVRTTVSTLGIDETLRRMVDTYEYNITARQLFFDGFKTVYDVAAANEAIRSLLYNHAVVSSQVRLRLRIAFVRLLQAQHALAIAEEIAQRRRQNVELLRLRYESGREHKGSCLTVQADLARAEYEIAQARRKIDIAQQMLNKELGRTKLALLNITGDFTIPPVYSTKPDMGSLMETTPFMQDLVARKEAARFKVSSEEADYFPQIYGDASAGRSDSEWPPDEGTTWSVSVWATYPLYEGGRREAEIKRAKAVLHQTLADERSGRDGILLTLEEAWNALQDMVDFIEVQRRFLEAAQERANITRMQYLNGLVLFDNWIIIEDELAQAQKAFLAAQANALIGEANWIQAKGGTLEYDNRSNK